MKFALTQALRVPAPLVMEKEVKLCTLCGALNYIKNAECFVCGWQGAFGSDAATIKIAWQRLYDRYEGVTLAHVTARRRSSALDAIESRPTPIWEHWITAVRGAWNRWQARRAARRTQKETASVNRIAQPLD